MQTAQLAALALAAATNAGVPPDLYSALITQESGWNQYAIGSAGEIGLAQLKPGTANDLGVNAYDPAQNLQGGANYLAQMYKRFGNWYDALRGYNQGFTGASRNEQAGSAYATSILNKAGLDPVSEKTNSPDSLTLKTTDILTGNLSTMFDDTVAKIIEFVKSKAVIIIMALIVIALAWFGLQAAIKSN